MVAGLVMSAAALGSILSASRLGKLADRVGHWNVIVGCLAVSAVLLVPQAFVTAGWQLVALRFLMGLSLGGLLPCIAQRDPPQRARASGRAACWAIRCPRSTPGRSSGPLLGGFVGGHFGMRAVFLGTCVLMAAGALLELARTATPTALIRCVSRTQPKKEAARTCLASVAIKARLSPQQSHTRSDLHGIQPLLPHRSCRNCACADCLRRTRRPTIGFDVDSPGHD